MTRNNVIKMLESRAIAEIQAAEDQAVFDALDDIAAAGWGPVCRDKSHWPDLAHEKSWVSCLECPDPGCAARHVMES